MIILCHRLAAINSRVAVGMGGHRERPLPAWRLRFDDVNATSVTIDPRTGSLKAMRVATDEK